MPWTLAHVCSRWRQVALGATRLWNRILIRNKPTPYLMPIIQEVFARCGQSTVNLELNASAWDSHASPLNFIHEVITPYAKRFGTLSLQMRPDSMMEDFLCMPAGLLDSLEEVDLWCERPFNTLHSDAYLFEGARSLRKVAVRAQEILPSMSFPTAMHLPWSQLTHIKFEAMTILPSIAHGILSQCQNLIECSLHMGGDGYHTDLPPERTVYPRGSILLPRLRTLVLSLGYDSTSDFYARCFGPLVLPSLVTFDLSVVQKTAQWSSPSEFIALINRSSCPLTHLNLNNIGSTDLGPILELFPSLTTLHAFDAFLSSSTIQLMAQGEYTPKIESLKCCVSSTDVGVFVDMLKTVWSKGARSRGWASYTGLTSASVSFPGVDGQILLDQSNRLRAIQKELGLEDRHVKLMSGVV